MFTQKQLEAIEDILDAIDSKDDRVLDKLAMIRMDQDLIKELKGATHSALWNLARSIPRKDKEAIAAAKAAGLVQIVGRNTEPQAERASRMKPEVVAAKTGDELLNILGLD